MVEIHPIEIEGRWKAGVALDYHTTSSTLVGSDDHGNPIFETVRPEIAELLFLLKYRNNRRVLPDIVAGAVSFLEQYREKFDIIVPVPPSTPRDFQPVIALAEGIGISLRVPVANRVRTTRPTTQLKNEKDPARRIELVKGLYEMDPGSVFGCKVLLFDDLFRSGTTMNEITDVLVRQGQAKVVRVLTITKTRNG